MRKFEHCRMSFTERLSAVNNLLLEYECPNAFSYEISDPKN